MPINMAVFGEALEHAAWRSTPSWAVIATDDRAFDLAMLRHMATRIGAVITEVPASHVVFMTQPDVVSETIERAAKAQLSRGARAIATTVGSGSRPDGLRPAVVRQ